MIRTLLHTNLRQSPAKAIAAALRSQSSHAAPPPSDAQPSTTPSPAPAPARRRTDLDSSDFRYLQSIADLAAFDPVLDLHPSKQFTPRLSPSQKHPTSIVLINDEPANAGYKQKRPANELLKGLPGEDDAISQLATVTDLSPNEIRNLFRFPLVTKRVVSMKSKGKMPSMYSLVVVGNGNGLVGVGEGKDATANKAVSKAFNQAVRSMDYVERYEDRTVWGSMESNFGSCSIQMRSRPPGFGLRVNHYLHQVAKAAGISDLSAKVHGSRNGTRVIKLAVSMLHGGSTSLDMGDGLGGKGQRKNKKTTGMMTAEEIGRARGRRAVAS